MGEDVRAEAGGDPLLECPDALEGLVQTSFRQGAILHRHHKAGDGAFRVRHVQQDVDAGPDKGDGLRPRVGVGVADGAHEQAVGDDGPPEAEPVAEEALQDRAGERGGQTARVEGGEGHVRRHDQIDVRLDGGAERDEVRPF